MTRGRLPQRAGSLGLNGSGTAVAVPPDREARYNMELQFATHGLYMYKGMYEELNDKQLYSVPELVKCSTHMEQPMKQMQTNSISVDYRIGFDCAVFYVPANTV